MALVLEKTVGPAAGHPANAAATHSESKLNIAVVFTSVNATLAALKRAGALAASLRARITLLVPQVVPYPLPLESPPVLLDFTERRFRLIADQSPVETTVRIYLCRDGWEMVSAELSAHSLVVVGGRRRWWPTRAERLVRKLSRAGHEVIFAETE
ncbi:MAG TPA: hypothetical protein VGF59_14210 [Bryobacteraceae bacterium]|jgi:hypothetical protein